MISFKLPSLGADMTEGKLLTWHVKPGDSVKRGQVVAVVDTSKAAIDVEIWQDGVVQELLVQPGETVPVGTVLATLSGVGEASAAMPGVAPDRQQAMRGAIAAAMSRSKREIPHYYLAETIHMQASMDWLQHCNAGLPITERMLPAVLLLKAVAMALKGLPEFNGRYLDGQFQPSAAVHVGVAISLRGGGLVAPAILDAQCKPLPQLMRELADLVKRARAGSLRSSEMSDATLTVTNLGDQGVASVFGVIYPPQVALVGFGSIVVRPWVVDGVVSAQPVVCATLAADHRVSDGHRGALFLAALRDLLQQPHMLAGAEP